MQNKVIPCFYPPRTSLLRQAEIWIYLLVIIPLSSCHKSYTAGLDTTTQYTIGKGTDTISDLPMLQLISAYRDSLNKTMQLTLVHSKTAMTKELPEGNLGNYCADACFRIAVKICKEERLPTPDFLFLNNGGLRAALPAGNITTGHVFELMPFENELVMIRLNRLETDSLLRIIASKGGAPVSGFRMRISEGTPAGISFNNVDAAAKEELDIITSDYLAAGNDGYTFLKTKSPSKLNIKVRDALIKDLQEHGRVNDTLNILKDGRITRL